MIIYSDEQLKRAKELVARNKKDWPEMVGLLARLEAAEDVASHASDAPITLVERWRKAAGK